MQKTHENQAYPRELCDASNMPVCPLLAPKSTKNATTKNELSTHQKNKICSMISTNVFFESEKKLHKMYGFLLVIEDYEIPSAAVGVTKSAKGIPP